MGASSVTSYEIKPDLDYWVPLPRSFPDEEWDTAEQWASDLAEVAFPDDADQRQVYQMMALDVVNNQMAEADHTLWYSPEDGHGMGTAHLMILDDDTEQGLAEIVLPKYDSVTPAQVKVYESDVFGQILQTTSAISVSIAREDDTAMLPVIGHVRTTGRSHGLVFLLEAYNSDLAALGLMMDPMVDIFDTVSFEDDDESGAKNP